MRSLPMSVRRISFRRLIPDSIPLQLTNHSGLKSTWEEQRNVIVNDTNSIFQAAAHSSNLEAVVLISAQRISLLEVSLVLLTTVSQGPLTMDARMRTIS